LLLLRPKDEEGASSEQRRIETLVVPLDGSELAEASLPYAEELALKMNLNISLIRVTPTPNLGFPGMEPYAYDGQMYVEMERAAESYLHQKQTELEQRGLRVERTLKGGHPAAHIIDHAEAMEGSLIVMSTHGRSGVGRWVMGSVADRILRASPSPILLVRSQGAAT
jgi:nucleotide-binding universal stress UspA family protein